MAASRRYPVKSNIPEHKEHCLRLLGANGAALTKVEGAAGVTVARTGEGAYTLTFAENPGTLVGADFCFQAATPADLKGYTLVLDTLDSSFVLPFEVYDSSFAAADLLANQWLLLTLKFRTTGVQ